MEVDTTAAAAAAAPPRLPQLPPLASQPPPLVTRWVDDVRLLTQPQHGKHCSVPTLPPTLQPTNTAEPG